MARLTKSTVLFAISLMAVVAAACTASATTPPTETPTSSPGSDAVVETPEQATRVDGATATPFRSDPSPSVPNETPEPQVNATSASGSVVVGPTTSTTPRGNVFNNSMFGSIGCDASAGDVQLTKHIYPPDQFDVLVPMGRMWDSHVTPTDHLYLKLKEERPRGMVMTPAAGRVIQIERFNNDQAPLWDGSATEPDLRVVIAHSCDLFSIYIHVGELAPEIASVVGDLMPGDRWFATPGTVIELDAGDPVAMFGGSSVDYSLHDGAVTLPGFMVPSHYDGEPWKVHTVDPFDYMSTEMKSVLQVKNERTVEPLGGQIDYDVRGTLAGNWFMDGTFDYGGGGTRSDYWNGHLAIAYDHIDPDQIRVSIGRDIGLTRDDCPVCGNVYAVKGNSPDPATVTVTDGIVRYELTGRQFASPDSIQKTVSDGVVLGTFLLQVLDDSSIKTEFFKGTPASAVSDFSAAAVVYRR